MSDDIKGLRDKLGKQGEEALGRFAQDLLENPLVSGALTRAFEARERAVQAQEAAMGALNIPSAADIERLTRRLRSVAQRLEGIEDAVDRLDRRFEGTSGAAAAQGIEEKLTELTAEVRRLATVVDGAQQAPVPVPREQERLDVSADKPKAKKKPAAL
jgi:CRP-like cAMP-binding protein